MKFNLSTLLVGMLANVLLAGVYCTVACAASPDFGPNVLIFGPQNTDTQRKLDELFHGQERNEFGQQRFAVLFKPGSYEVDAQVGFYTQLLGLGQSPDDVRINGGIRTMASWMRGNATVNFWRSIENMAIDPSRHRGTSVWAVSQGTDLRRVHFQHNLNLWDGGWSSGGFLADCKIDQRIISGSQQQWLSRNAEWGKWDGGVWNMVFVGVNNPPPGRWPDRPITVTEKTPVSAEKPYLFIDGSGNYAVKVPQLVKDSVGCSWSAGETAGKVLSIDEFFIAQPLKDNADTINSALAAGKNLILTPGIYHLDKSIRIMRSNTVVLGLGYATLIPATAAPAMVISDVAGVKLAGLIFDAGPVNTPSLLQVGEPNSTGSNADNPICLYDIVARAGGSAAGCTDCFVTINSNNVIGDNAWVWRADHGKGAGWDSNKVANGLIVNGKDVTFYGLFVEHCQQYQTLWNGNGGRVYFYQSEMPYDPPSQADWSHDGVKGYASYKVADTVTTHEAYGLGIYCYFTAAPVVADNAVEVPGAPGVKTHNACIVRLGGKNGGGIAHVMNGKGDGVAQVKPVRVSD
jgi:hypothetical protein